MDAFTEKVSNAVDTVQDMGFGYKAVIGKDEDGNIISEQFLRENGKWKKK